MKPRNKILRKSTLRKTKHLNKNFIKKINSIISKESDFKIERLIDQVETILLFISIILLGQPIVTIWYGITDSIYITAPLALFTIILVIKYFYELIITSFGILAIVVIIISLSADYSIQEFNKGYNDIIINLYENNLNPFSANSNILTKETLNEKMNFSREAREFAMEIATKNFEFAYDSFGLAIRYVSAYQEILNHWRFINERGEFVQSVADQIKFYRKNDYFAGDCDDFAILLANTFLYIGAKSIRYVFIPGHIFIELNIVDKNSLDELLDLIGLLYSAEADSLAYTAEADSYWVSFDWNKFPVSRYEQKAVTNKIKI